MLLACRRVTLEWALRRHVLATGLVGFFFIGIAWIVAGALLIAGAVVARREFS